MATTQRAHAHSHPKLHQRSAHFPRWRIFTWVILAFNLLMLIWVISGIASNARNCSGLTGDALTNCQAGNVGTGIGVGLLILLWALGDIILGVLWLVTRPRTRDCPVCGNGVRSGMTQCRTCGYDFTQWNRQNQWNQQVQSYERDQQGQQGQPDQWNRWKG
jgi:predicted nucleic acid-binding Zn ribbon protein